MGRGRQKAKHTKVARELKYFSPDTDLNALEREIGHPSDSAAEQEYIDKWADLYPEEDEDELDEDSDDDSEHSDGGNSAHGQEEDEN